MKAIKAGQEFNLFHDDEAAHVSLVETGSFVNVDGAVYPLMYGATFEESQKIDALLDAKGALPVSQHIAPPVQNLFDPKERIRMPSRPPRCDEPEKTSRKSLTEPGAALSSRREVEEPSSYNLASESRDACTASSPAAEPHTREKGSQR